MRVTAAGETPSRVAPFVAVLALALTPFGCGDSTSPRDSRATPSASSRPPATAPGGPSDTAPSARVPPRPVRGPRVRLSTLEGRVAFSRRADIWVARADGTHARRVVATRGPQDAPTWSPDGARLAYRDARRGYNHNDEIYSIAADGSRPRNLTRTPFNDWSPAWSPNGRLIAFYASELYVMRADGHGVRQVTEIEGEYPAWAPDGRRLAFMSSQPGARGADPNYDVFVVGVDGTGLRQLTDFPGEDGWPSWSPDGRWIAFSTTHDDTGESPGASSVYLMRPDGSGKHRLALPISAAFPIWAPDGRTIMFTSRRPTGEHERQWVMRRDGSGWRPTSIDGGIAAWIAPRRSRTSRSRRGRYRSARSIH
jgi:Tol biopolymer transport system component